MIHGRHAEQAAIAELLERAQTFHGGVLVVHGQAGAGKSTLLHDAIARAEDMQVLKASGVESESELPYAGLHQLLRPVLPLVHDLPRPQAQALRIAFGLEQGVDHQRFLVGLAVLTLIAEAAERGPVLCVVDDAHLLDPPSADALAFAGRRVEAERIAILVSVRAGAGHPFPGGGMPELHIGGLDSAAAARLLEELAQTDVPPEVSARLVESTGGIPLALVELATALTTEQLAGRRPLPLRLPLTDGVERAFLDQVALLSQAAQRWLLVAAADDTKRLVTIMEAAAKLRAGAAALDSAEQAGLIRIRAGELEFRHPLVRSAIYQAASTADRRRAHQALADVLDDAADADRRTWHLANAAVSPDPALVQDLDATAERLRSRGGYEAASTCYERAAELTPESDARARRLWLAGHSAWLAGQIPRASGQLRSAGTLTADPELTAHIDQLRGWIELSAGSAAAGTRLLITAAEQQEAVQPDSARELLAAAAEAAYVTADRMPARELRRLSARLPQQPSSERGRLFVDILAAYNRLLDGEASEPMRSLRTAVRRALALDQADLLVWAGHAAFYVGDGEMAYVLNAELVARARAAGAVSDLLFGLQRLSLAELVTGRWTAANATTWELSRLARETSQPAVVAASVASLGLLAALRGDAKTHRTMIGQAQQRLDVGSLGVFDPLVRDLVQWAGGVHAATTGQLLSAELLLTEISHPGLLPFVVVDRCEAAAAAGRWDTAQAISDAFDSSLADSDDSAARARQSHCHAVLAQGHVAEQRYQAALDHHQQGRQAFDRARTQLAHGEYLRRARRRVDARPHLQAALESFIQLGATPWMQRAAAELRATGRTARVRDPSTALRLTPQELQVARFVARGLSNRDVATQLFMSRRTVDFHLHNVFLKLGISSRIELTQVQLE